MTLTKGYKDDAGYDVVLDEDVKIFPGLNIIPLGSIVTKKGECAIIAPRSSAAKLGMLIANCPVDTNYNGIVHAIVVNTTNNTFTYHAGTAFCQIVFIKLANCHNEFTVKKKGKRGCSNFGQTGGSDVNIG